MLDTLRKRLRGRIVIACIGNVLKSDDGAGPALAEKLEGRLNAEVINCWDTPENDTGAVKRAQPDTIVVVDAMNMDIGPGSVSIVEKEQLEEMDLYTTHNVPLKVFVNYLAMETGADIFLIGIQPETLALGKVISPKVSKTIDTLADIFIELLGK
jgi:hydrogenase 3 maturation protease